MSDQKIVVGVDAGSAKIVTIVGKVDEEGTVNILGVSEVPSTGIKKGQIVDIEQAVNAISNSLDGAERMAGHHISRVIASIGGSHIESLNSKGVVAVSSPQGEINDGDIERVIDAARAVSFPTTREIIHVLPRFYTVDGQEGIKVPIGMTGVRLEVDTHIISASTTAVRNFEKALSEVGVEVDGFAFSGYASSLAVLSDTEKELGVILVDMGAGTTDISIFVDGAVAYSAVLPVGARHITNDIAIGLRVSLESAEKIKLFLSKPLAKRPLGLEEDEEKKDPKAADEMDLTSLRLPEDLKKVSYKTVLEGIIRPRLNEIFTMVGSELKKSGLGGQTPAGLVITGGGAKTVGLVDAAKRMLAMPVRVGYPNDIKGIVDEAGDTGFATAVGLLRFGSKEETKTSFNFSMPKLPGMPKFGGNNKIGRKITDLLKSFIP